MNWTTTLCRASFAAFVFPLFSLACVAEPDDGSVGQADDEIVEEDACQPAEFRFCEQNDDPTLPGEQRCIEDDEGVIGWLACLPRKMDGPADCYDNESWDGETCFVDDSVASTPIVLSFERGPVTYHTTGGDFDLTGLGYNVTTDWPTAKTPWLVLDRNGNGHIDDGGELFGSATRLSSGGFARHGFEALAELDADGDGVITKADPAFGSLQLWADHDADRQANERERTSLTEAGVLAISVEIAVESRCDARGNCERERASFQYRDAAGQIRAGEAIDVHLKWH